MITAETHKDRNTRRRERYARDPSYRQDIIERERSKRVTSDMFDSRENLPTLPTFGKVREAKKRSGEAIGSRLTFTIEEAASALGRTPKSLYKYFSKNLFPRPEHIVRGPSGLEQEAYLEQELRSLIAVFGKHQTSTPYYGTYHEETRQALFGAMAGATK